MSYCSHRVTNRENAQKIPIRVGKQDYLNIQHPKTFNVHRCRLRALLLRAFLSFSSWIVFFLFFFPLLNTSKNNVSSFSQISSILHQKRGDLLIYRHASFVRVNHVNNSKSINDTELYGVSKIQQRKRILYKEYVFNLRRECNYMCGTRTTIVEAAKIKYLVASPI